MIRYFIFTILISFHCFSLETEKDFFLNSFLNSNDKLAYLKLLRKKLEPFKEKKKIDFDQKFVDTAFTALCHIGFHILEHVIKNDNDLYPPYSKNILSFAYSFFDHYVIRKNFDDLPKENIDEVKNVLNLMGSIKESQLTYKAYNSFLDYLFKMKTDCLKMKQKQSDLWNNIINSIDNSLMKNHLSRYTEKINRSRLVDFNNPISDEELEMS